MANYSVFFKYSKMTSVKNVYFAKCEDIPIILQNFLILAYLVQNKGSQGIYRLVATTQSTLGLGLIKIAF